jgi:hypothetical protein
MKKDIDIVLTRKFSLGLNSACLLVPNDVSDTSGFPLRFIILPMEVVVAYGGGGGLVAYVGGGGP